MFRGSKAARMIYVALIRWFSYYRSVIVVDSVMIWLVAGSVVVVRPCGRDVYRQCVSTRYGKTCCIMVIVVNVGATPVFVVGSFWVFVHRDDII